MAAYYLDSSALAKRYVAETGSAWVTDLMNPLTGNHTIAQLRADFAG